MIVFRADGDCKIGMGHIMRCLSIAAELTKAGRECLFAVKNQEMVPFVCGSGHKCLVLSDGFHAEKPADEEAEALREFCRQAFLDFLKRNKPELLIVDSYDVTSESLDELRSYAKLVYIDDLAAFAYPVDALINYNIYAKASAYESLYREAGMSCPLLMTGLDYVPLRESFRDVPARPQKEKCTDVLISTGGADPIRLGLRLSEYISNRICGQTVGEDIPNRSCDQSAEDDLTYHILVGAMNPDRDEILEIGEKCKNLQVHSNVKDMRGLILGLDLAVCAAGSTLYELAACGLPAITYVLADNQRSGAQAFERLGLMDSCGDLRGRDDAPEILYHKIRKLADDYDRRCRMSADLQIKVDGYGAQRIAEALEEMCN